MELVGKFGNALKVIESWDKITTVSEIWNNFES